jgi:hypothetical protein
MEETMITTEQLDELEDATIELLSNIHAFRDRLDESQAPMTNEQLRKRNERDRKRQKRIAELTAATGQKVADIRAEIGK